MVLRKRRLSTSLKKDKLQFNSYFNTWEVTKTYKNCE